MYRATSTADGAGSAIHAMSGIDLASGTWESTRSADLEAARRRIHPELRAYASSLFGATPAETGERARRFADQGFTAVKFGWDPMGRTRETDVALVREAPRRARPQRST